MYKRAVVLAALWSLLSGDVCLAATDHTFYTIKVPLVDTSGGSANGVAKIICSGGYDADRVQVRGNGLKPDTAYNIYYVNTTTQKRQYVGPDPGEGQTDRSGTQHYIV